MGTLSEYIKIPLIVVGCGVALYGFTVFYTGRWMTENARYTIVPISADLRSKLKGFEVRRTAPSVIAKVHVDEADIRRAGNAGFRPLAGYIFGRNAKKASTDEGDVIGTRGTEAAQAAKIAMTTPVTVQPAQSQKIAMTTPVTFQGSAGGGVGGHIISFTMPAQYTEVSQLPAPLDGRVVLEEQPARFELVSTRRGQWPNQAETERWYAEVIATAQSAGLKLVPASSDTGPAATTGVGSAGHAGTEPLLAGWRGYKVRQYAYDPPFIPSFLKLTEVAVEIESPL